jgi:hypothetical protein
MKTCEQLAAMAFTLEDEKKNVSEGFPETRLVLGKQTKEELINTILALTKMYYRVTEVKEPTVTSGAPF